MLTRSSQVGEFYVMSPPQIPPKGDGLHTCDLLVYDEESDRHVRITWEDALEATLINDAEGFYTAAADTTMADGNQNTTTLGSWADAARKWSTYNKGSGDYKAAAADGGIDVRIIIARPFIEHLMHNVVMTVAGRDTGATLFGPADMQLSANTQVKTIEGHYTGHFKAVVTKPQNVLVMKDVACAGYVAGMNTRWFAKPESGGAMSAEAAQENIQARLSFSNDDTDRYASMLAFPCWEGQFQSGQLDTVMSVTTRLLPWEVNNAGTHASFPGGDKMFAKYAAALQLGQVHYGEDMKAAENQDFISQANHAPFEPPCLETTTRPFAHLRLYRSAQQGSTNNATCFLGPSRRYDPFTKSFLSLIPGQGHFGPDAIPGVSRVAFFPTWSGLVCRPVTTTPTPTLTAPGCPLEAGRERLAQGRARQHGLARARPARPDGLLGALRRRRRRNATRCHHPRPSGQSRCRRRSRRRRQHHHPLHQRLCPRVRVRVCPCVCVCVCSHVSCKARRTVVLI